MSLHPEASYPIPEDTQRVARAAFPHGNIYMQVADRLGNLYHDAQFTALFPRRGQPAEAPARLALATILQFAEGLSDRQTAEAVRSRIDWKYMLGLDLTDPGFHHTVLSEFRTRLVAGEAEQLLLDTLLTLARAQGLLKARGRQRTDSTHVLAAIRVLNRLERVGETLRAALNSLAVVAPAWVQTLAPPEWYDRYGHRVENYQMPKTDGARKALRRSLGRMAKRCSRRLMARASSPGCGTSQRSRPSDVSGLNNTLTSMTRSAGVKSKTCHPQRSSLPPPMIPRPATARSARSSGLAIRSISLKPATRRSRI